jgi:hypothetical protein
MTYSSTAIYVIVTSEANLLQVLLPEPESLRRLQSSKVPSSRIGRLFHYGGTKHNHLTNAITMAHVSASQASQHPSVTALLLNYSAARQHPLSPPGPHPP